MLELKNICYEVETEDSVKKILKNVNLTIDKHKFVVITGPNGSGKSTLARIIAGIDMPTSGQIILDGVDITEMSITERARQGISIAFQQPAKFKGLKVIDLLRIAAGKELTIPEACDYLLKVGLCAMDYVDREVNSSLSGGELKRIEIATIIARKTKLSIFDEPEAGIDLWSFQKLIEVFVELRDNIEDASLIIISHQERILEIADEIVVLKDGQVDRHGSMGEIMPELTGTSLASPMCPLY